MTGASQAGVRHDRPVRLSACLPALTAILSVGCGLTLDLQPGVDGGVSTSFDARVRDAGAPDGGLAQVDAGARDAGDVCVTGAEVCNGADDDCDSLIDEGYDLASDALNCGGCGRVCTGNGGSPSCVSGRCSITCAAGRGDCDGNPANGCEATFGDPTSCGSCGRACPSSTPLCVREGERFHCAPDCTPPLVPCGGVCVDRSSDLANCGACGRACFNDPSGTLECIGGRCYVTDCGDGRGDCNMDGGDGCEALLNTNVNCGSCGASCRAGATCVGTACVMAGP